MQIGSLPNGTPVQIKNLDHVFKDIVIIHGNRSGTTIKGMMNDGEKFVPIHSNFVISNATEVIPLNKPIMSETKIETENTSTEKKRGRKIIPLTIPSGEFDINALAELNKISAPNAYARLLKYHKPTVVREVSGGRGKPRKIYIVNKS